jgi:hypothetical protein
VPAIRTLTGRAVTGAVLSLTVAISTCLTATSAAAAPPAVLGSGGVLPCGNRLVSGDYRLEMQCDGNLVEYGPGGVHWSSRTNGPTDNYRLEMQGDGNLVIYTSNGRAVFATGTNVSAGNGAVLEMQDDGNAVVYGAGHVARWASKSRGEAAITWYHSRIGSTAYDSPQRLCEKAAENAFGRDLVYNTAADDWRAVGSPRNGVGTAPRGTLVFYQTSTAGHVALSLGNGQVISSSSKNSPHAIGISPISGWFAPGLGWANSLWGAPW